MWSNVAKALVSMFIVFLLISILKNRKKSDQRKKWGVLCVEVLLLVILALFPIENLLYSFPSVESLYGYIYPGCQLVGIVDGEASSLILCSNQQSTNAITAMIAPKETSGYKIGGVLSRRDVIKGYSNGYSVSIFCDPSNTDYYVIIQGVSEDCAVSFRDNFGSVFFTEKEEISFDDIKYMSVTAYGRINHYDSSYSIVVEQFGEHLTVKLADE